MIFRDTQTLHHNIYIILTIVITIAIIKIVLTSQGLREDEDGRNMGRRGVQQEHGLWRLWFCLWKTSHLLVCSSTNAFAWNVRKTANWCIFYQCLYLNKECRKEDFLHFLWNIKFELSHFPLMSFGKLWSDFPVEGDLIDWNWVRICRWSITEDPMCQQ